MLPALTQACAAPCLTKSMQTRIEESFLPRKACDGWSPISICCEVCWTASRSSGSARWVFIAAAMAVSSPTRMSLTSGNTRSVASAAGTTTAGPWSPPIASRAMVALKRLFALAVYDLAAAIISVWTHVVAQVGFPGCRLDGKTR